MEYLTADPSIQLGQALRVALKCLHEAPVFSKSPRNGSFLYFSCFAPYFVCDTDPLFLDRLVIFLLIFSPRTWFLRGPRFNISMPCRLHPKQGLCRRKKFESIFFRSDIFLYFLSFSLFGKRERALVRARARWKGEWKLTGAQNEPYCARFLTYEGSPGERKCKIAWLYTLTWKVKIRTFVTTWARHVTIYDLFRDRVGHWVQSHKKFNI